jgi:hypothetical protein
LHHRSLLANTDVVGERPISGAEDLVTWLKLRDVSAAASTVPAKSTPRNSLFGLRSPAIMRTMYGVPVMVCQSTGFTEVA